MEKVHYDYGFNILVKGEYDYYLTKNGCFKITAMGGNKRCGGIGDLLAGASIACASWDLTYGPLLACWLIKKATKRAFEKERRGMTAPTVLS
jgi:NAD(P)H-hydrate repair Nnr-like enzyme with NAD(P)H-hydrate dehydratase domain